MLKLNETQIKKRINELKHYRGWLPFQFDAYLSSYDRKKFLQSAGLWEEVEKRNLEVMQGIRDNKPDDDKYLDELLKIWVIKNPQFKDFIQE